MLAAQGQQLSLRVPAGIAAPRFRRRGSRRVPKTPSPSNFPSRTFKPKNEEGHQPRQHHRKGAANYTKFEHLDETKDLAPNLRPLSDQIPLSGAAAKGVLARQLQGMLSPGSKRQRIPARLTRVNAKTSFRYLYRRLGRRWRHLSRPSRPTRRKRRHRRRRPTINTRTDFNTHALPSISPTATSPP